MKNNPSKAHHYIPVFYLENFVNSDGEFFIYKVKDGRFKMNGKPFTPKSHFFKEKGNTFEMPEMSGMSEDFLETKFYSPLDSDVAKIFQKILNSRGEPKYGLEDKEIPHLEYFFSHLYWRNPSSDQHVKELLEKKSLKELGIVAKGESSVVEKFEAKLKSHPDFYKFMKSMLPGSLFGNYKLALDHKFLILEYPFNLPGILGDNPVILKQWSHNNYVEDMLVPIAKDLVFSRNRKEVKFIDANVKVLIDMMLLKQANEFVCVTDKNYIEQLEDTYNDVKIADLENLRQLLFHGLEKDHGQI